MVNPSRRAVLIGASSVAFGAVLPFRAQAQDYDPGQVYGAVDGEPFAVPAINLNRVKPQFLRSLVAYDGNEPAGTIVIDPAKRFLYLVQGDGQAMRYGVGVGRQGFAWSGRARIHDKQQWPDWYPPKEMLARDPSIMEVMHKLRGGIGMPGGPGNPLGARAMYLWQGNHDTLFRIHGTIEPYSIGTSVSSGCIRMINQDVMDLFTRVPVGTEVVVLGDAKPSQVSARRDQPPFDPNYDPQNPDQYGGYAVGQAPVYQQAPGYQVDPGDQQY